MLTIVIPFSLYRMSILGSALSATKPRSIKNAMIFWFYNLQNCLKPYMLHNRYTTNLSLIALKDFILDGNFMKIDRSFSISRLLRYALTISTWSIDNPNRQEIAKNMRSNSLFTIGEKVL